MTTFDYEDIIFEIYSGVILMKWIYLYVIYSVYFSEYQSVRPSLLCVCVYVLALPAVFLKVVSNVRARITCMGDCN